MESVAYEASKYAAKVSEKDSMITLGNQCESASHRILNLIEMIEDRLLGPRPEMAGRVTANEGSGVTGMLGVTRENLARAEDRLQSLLSRVGE